jgi:TatD DNase family protein
MPTVEPPTFIDSHVHLDDGQFENDLDAVLDNAAAVGVQQVVNIGYKPARWQSSIDLSARRPEVSFTLGLHPHHADEFGPHVIAELSSLIEEHRPVAIGEIGLDYFRDLADRTTQQRAFSAQLQLAVDSRLPVVLHLRGDVEDDLRRALVRTPKDLVCVLHSFDGTEQLASWGLERGYLFGVGGLVTRKDNERLRNIVRSLQLDRLLLETDSPYLSPAGIKDRRNSPVNIPVIARTISDLMQIDLDTVATETTNNARRVFKLRENSGTPAGPER